MGMRKISRESTDDMIRQKKLAKHSPQHLLNNGLIREAGMTPPNQETGKHKTMHHTYKQNQTGVQRHYLNNDKEFKRHFRRWLNNKE